MKWCTPTRSSHNNNLRVCKAEVGAGSESRPRHSLRHRVAGKHHMQDREHYQHQRPPSSNNAHTAPQAASSALTWTLRSCAGGKRAIRPSRGVYPSF